MLTALFVNNLLDNQPWARERLRPHAGKVAALSGGFFVARLRVSAEGRVETAPADDVADVHIELPASALPHLADGPEALSRHARVQGDAGFAETIAELLRHLRPDLGGRLAPFLGDALAHRIEQGSQTAAVIAADLARRIGGNAYEYVAEEKAWVIKSTEAQAVQSELVELRDDLARLEKRVTRLAGGTDAVLLRE